MSSRGMSHNNLLFMFWKLVRKSPSCFICMWNMLLNLNLHDVKYISFRKSDSSKTPPGKDLDASPKKCSCAAFVFLYSPLFPPSFLVSGSAPQRWSVDGFSAAEPHSWPLVRSIWPGVAAAPRLVRLHLPVRASTKSQLVLQCVCVCVFIGGVLLVILQLLIFVVFLPKFWHAPLTTRCYSLEPVH